MCKIIHGHKYSIYSQNDRYKYISSRNIIESGILNDISSIDIQSILDLEDTTKPIEVIHKMESIIAKNLINNAVRYPTIGTNLSHYIYNTYEEFKDMYTGNNIATMGTLYRVFGLQDQNRDFDIDYVKILKDRINKIRMADIILADDSVEYLVDYRYKYCTKPGGIIDNITRFISNTDYGNEGNGLYDWGFGCKVYISEDSLANKMIKPYQYLQVSLGYDVVVVSDGDTVDGKWRCSPVKVGKTTYTDVELLVDCLANNGAKNILLLICNTDRIEIFIHPCHNINVTYALGPLLDECCKDCIEEEGAKWDYLRERLMVRT